VVTGMTESEGLEPDEVEVPEDLEKQPVTDKSPKWKVTVIQLAK
jgi:hypothetical protein